MDKKTTRLLIQHEKDLETINNRRYWWSWSSLCTVISIIFLTTTWEWLNHIQSERLWWMIVSAMIIVAINWWYWTIRILRIMITHQRIEYELIKSILHDIKLLKYDIKEFRSLTIDDQS